MIPDGLKEFIYDKDIDKDVKSTVLPLLFKEVEKRKRRPLTNFLVSAPFAALLSAVLVAGITELLRQQTRGEELSHERSLERQKFQYEVINSSLSKLKTPQERAETLRFLHDIKILDGLNEEKLIEWASADSTPPAFSAAVTPATTIDAIRVFSEVDLFARTLFGEIRGGSPNQVENVASVILNRARAGYRGDSVGTVVLAAGQFSSWNPGTPNQNLLVTLPQNDPMLLPFLTIARRALEGKIVDRTEGALHYHSKVVPPPDWADGAELTLDDGAHLFFVGVQ